MTKTFSIKTLGCKLNQYDSSLIAGYFQENGWKAARFGEPADVVIINTCTVTDRSDKKCRNLIRQGARHSRSGGVIVTGCMVDADRSGILSMPEVLAVFSNREKDLIFEKINSQIIEPALHADTVMIQHDTAPLPFGHTRGYLKIQDGCDNSCSYCIIPSVRGKGRSRPFVEILDHGKKLIDSGCPEIILTGITTGGYSCDGKTLPDVVEALAELEGQFRIRITSIEPVHVTSHLIELFSHKKVCSHIHLPIQSGSDKILERMNRPYSLPVYMDIIEKIKEKHPDIAIGTDIIIGFPGEEDVDFQGSLDAIHNCGYSYVHQFSFSARTGTPAASMGNRPPQETIAERSLVMRTLAEKISSAYRKRFIGIPLECVIEKNRNNGIFTAVSSNYIKLTLMDSPENEKKRGTLSMVTLNRTEPEQSFGTLL
ncbi:MAG TPA: tRNA (N(6)-L-threonylcarbamoyladenosine(37)-C(2))-methylthiotransferase MtaB [Spirochaetota bacterium]|nr:tRNA (N(6)-L-threonylcarbamoyladenosine(37)-C(2))-methylthiotransferase MtaB [Spirochaetota bacterium]HPQ53480.1 tRNA (N(6)-L-threonylcarbamoyladenosine(37)-C(2))-methylthiotransferase MtaB [Spirochaetota bacterium]